MTCRQAFLLALVAPLLACVDATAPQPPGTSPAPPPTTGSAGVRVEVKLRPALGARLSNGVLRDRRGELLARVEQLRVRHGAAPAAPLFTVRADRLDALARAAVARGRSAPAVGSWFELTAPDAATAERLVAALRASGDVDDAYLAPSPAPPPGDVRRAMRTAAASFTAGTFTAASLAASAGAPSFVDWQSYFAAAPRGTGVAPLRGTLGARGAGVTVVDVEYAWDYDHEELRFGDTVHLGGTPYLAFGADHGTAVLGILAAAENGFGITGGAPAAALRTVATHFDGWYQPANAVLLAASRLQPGDVLLLELQTYGPGDVLVPIEWIGSVYDAIQAAVAAGIVVVEAGANGGMSLDDPMFGGRFDRTRYNSGALVVGAGDASRTPHSFSSHGSRVDVQALGWGVTTIGYGDLYRTGPTDAYTAYFGGTSSASAIVAATVAALQGYAKAAHGRPLAPAEVAALLRQTGTSQAADHSRPIGPLPNLDAAVQQLGPGRPAAGRVTALTLVDADRGVPIAGYDPIPDGAILDLATLPTRNLNVLARTSPAVVGSVRFALDDDPNFRTESMAPYALAGDCGDGCYHAWTPSSGTHTLTATPFGEASAGGAAGPALAIRFTVVDEPPTGPRVAALVSRASGKCATVLDGASGAGAVIGIEPCDGRAAQRFTLPAPGTSGAIHAAGGALCVDAASGYGNDGDAILLWSCHGGANQQWALGPDGLLRGIGGKCMDVSGGHTADRTPLILWSCHARSNQQWDAGRAVAGRD